MACHTERNSRPRRRWLDAFLQTLEKLLGLTLFPFRTSEILSNADFLVFQKVVPSKWSHTTFNRCRSLRRQLLGAMWTLITELSSGPLTAIHFKNIYLVGRAIGQFLYRRRGSVSKLYPYRGHITLFQSNIRLIIAGWVFPAYRSNIGQNVFNETPVCTLSATLPKQQPKPLLALATGLQLIRGVIKSRNGCKLA